MSCIARGDMPGPGCRTIWLWTTVSTSVGGISRPITGLRMSASMNSVRSSGELRLARVEPGDVLDLGVALEPAREEAPRGGCPRR